MSDAVQMGIHQPDQGPHWMREPQSLWRKSWNWVASSNKASNVHVLEHGTAELGVANPWGAESDKMYLHSKAAALVTACSLEHTSSATSLLPIAE